MRLRMIGLLALLLALLPAGTAYACDYVVASDVASMSADAQVIAIGTLKAGDGAADVISLEVEEYLRGDAGTQTLRLNNRQVEVDAACTLRAGAAGRLPDGLRVLAFLVKDELAVADWRLSGSDSGNLLKIPADPSHELVTYNGEIPAGTLEQARATLAELGELGAGNGGGGVNGGIAEPMPMPPVVVAPAIGRVEVKPFFPPGQGIAQPGIVEVEAPGNPSQLPRMLLGVLIAVMLGLLAWTVVERIRQRRVEE